MSVAPGIVDAARRLTATLESAKTPYAVGDAVAMTLLRHVRATKDLDVLILLPAVRSQELADALGREGFEMRDADDRPAPIDVREMVRSTRDVGHFRIWLGETRVELFSPRVPLQDSMLRRRVKVDLEGFSLWITTAEDLILMKMVFHRPKDIEDVRHLLAANRGSLDLAYIESWIPRTLDDAVGEELRDIMRRTGAVA